MAGSRRIGRAVRCRIVARRRIPRIAVAMVVAETAAYVSNN